MSYQSVFVPDLFKDTVSIVTGGGSGLGRCTAHELSALGSDIVLVGRSEEKLKKVKDELVEDGGNVLTFSADIRDESAITEVVSSVLETWGRIDNLVNNAGGQFRAPLEKISANGFDAVVRNNLLGGYNLMRQAYLQWMKDNGGGIVNIIADMWGGWPMYGHSGAARAGMKNLTETAAAEWGSSGIRVNAVAPGTILSSGLDTYDGVLILISSSGICAAKFRYRGWERNRKSQLLWYFCCLTLQRTSLEVRCESTAAHQMEPECGKRLQKSTILMSLMAFIAVKLQKSWSNPAMG